MLVFKRLEIDGFGPFASRQILEFPSNPGVTVVYGENMAGKTSISTALHWVLFGTAERGSRSLPLHQLANKQNAADGRHEFSVSLTLDLDGTEYELVRTCRPKVPHPRTDGDYEESVLLRADRRVLGPQERERHLEQLIPRDIARFFLFDGELLREYAELLVDESRAGRQISDAIERILGLPILKMARNQVIQLHEQVQKLAAQEATRRETTRVLGEQLTTTEARLTEHRAGLEELNGQFTALLAERARLEDYLGQSESWGAIAQERDQKEQRLELAIAELQIARTDLRELMKEAWRTVLREPVRVAREAARMEAEKAFAAVSTSLRLRVVEQGHCEVCDREADADTQARLAALIPTDARERGSAGALDVLTGLGAMAQLARFAEVDVSGEVRRLWTTIKRLELEEVTLGEDIKTLSAQLEESEVDVRRKAILDLSKANQEIGVVREGIDEAEKIVNELEQTYRRQFAELKRERGGDISDHEQRAELLERTREVLSVAVDEYKLDLRRRVEATATMLFRLMTTEKTDYDGLTINDGYGLSIRHRDGRIEEVRSAGAEHVVALALMGALQQNAPLRGPIVMDSPFGRLDEGHTSNVLSGLHQLAHQIVLLVFRAEIDEDRARRLLGHHLLKEYEIVKISARVSELRERR